MGKPIGDTSRCVCQGVEKHGLPKSPFRQYGLCMFIKPKVLSLGPTPGVMSPWKHEHSGPHLSRSQSCLCSRRSISWPWSLLRAPPAPVSCFRSSEASCGGPWGSWSLARGRPGRAHSTEAKLRSCHPHSSGKHSLGFQEGPSAILSPPSFLLSLLSDKIPLPVCLMLP